MRLLGIDIGGTGIKGAPVDLEKGTLAGERFRVETPSPGTPEAILDAIGQILDHFSYKGPVGCTFPGVVRRGEIQTAAHLDPSWVGVHAEQEIARRFRQPAAVINDADAAAVAEAKYGAGQGENGLILMVTLGTGIGTGLIYRGTLVPNSELGHLEIRGKDAERRASNSARESRDMSWKKWASRVSEYLDSIERLINPDLIILGGGVVKEAEKFVPRLETKAPVVVAKLGNQAGIVGAAHVCEVHASVSNGRGKKAGKK
jgi:polyphosphate glucokinase